MPDIRQLLISRWIETATLAGAVHLAVALVLGALLTFLDPASWPVPGVLVLAVAAPSLALILCHQLFIRRSNRQAPGVLPRVYPVSALPGIGWAIVLLTSTYQPPVFLLVASAAFMVVAVAVSILAARWQELLLVLAPGLAANLVGALVQQRVEITVLAVAMLALTAVAGFQLVRQRCLAVGTELTREELRAARDRVNYLENKYSQLCRTRDYLLAAISHDLRQPAQAIGLLAHGIHDAAPTGALRDQARDLSQVSDKVNDLVARLLDLARLDFGSSAAQPAWIELGDLFVQLRGALDRRAEQAGVQLDFSEPALLIHADRSLVECVFANLLTNAIEHAGATLVSVEVTRPQSGNEPLRIHVIDNGRGLDNARARLVNRPDTSTARTLLPTHSVHGLGLHVASRLARQGGHRLTVKATEGVGSCFTLSVDQWKYQRRAAAPVVAARSEQTGPVATVIPIHRARPAWRQVKRQVLIIEDDALVRVALMSMLTSAGFEVTACDSGGDAIDAIHADGCCPDIIISDWFLANGLTAENAMPGVQAALPSVVPVIVLTGMQSSGLSDQELSRRMGGAAVRFLRKPVRVELLIRRIRELLDEAASQ